MTLQLLFSFAVLVLSVSSAQHLRQRQPRPPSLASSVLNETSEQRRTLPDVQTCVPTAQVELHQDENNWKLVSLNALHQAKTVGGDVLQVVYVEECSHAHQAVVKSSTAHVHDNNDGTYTLEFVDPHGLFATNGGKGHGHLQVTLQQTCNLSNQVLDTNNAQAVLTKVKLPNLPVPPMHAYQTTAESMGQTSAAVQHTDRVSLR